MVLKHSMTFMIALQLTPPNAIAEQPVSENGAKAPLSFQFHSRRRKTLTSISDENCLSGRGKPPCHSIPATSSTSPDRGLENSGTSLPGVERLSYFAPTADSPPPQHSPLPTYCPPERGARVGDFRAPADDGKCALTHFSDTKIDVRQFGAKCDGKSDDTTSIQSALNALSEDGVNKLIFPGGTCVISNALLIERDSAMITGSSLYGTRILQKNLSAQIFRVPWSNIQISNLRLDFDGKPNAGADAIYTSGANNIFSELYIYKAHRGIVFEGMSGGFVHHVQIWRYENSAIFIQNSGDIYIDSFIFNADTIDSNNVGLRIQNRAEAITVSNGDILGGTHSMLLDASDNREGVRPAFNKFSNVYFDSSSQEPVTVNNSATTNFVNSWFSGGRSAARSGVSINNSIGIYFTGSTFFNNGYHGATVQNTSKQIVFVNCQFTSNSVSKIGEASGIHFESGASDFMVSNSVLSNSGYKNTQKFGVLIDRGQSDRYNVTQNLVTGNLDKGVNDLGTGANKTVTSNY